MNDDYGIKVKDAYVIGNVLISIDKTLKYYLALKVGLITKKEIAEYLNIDLDELEKGKYFL